jgi:hypothetical protein
MAYKRNIVEDEAIERIDAEREQPVSLAYQFAPVPPARSPLIYFLAPSSLAEVASIAHCQVTTLLRRYA